MSGETRRINRGRGHSYELDGVKVPGVTTVLSKGYPKDALIKWAAETTAGYAVDNWEALGGLPPSERLKEIEGGRFRVQRAAALRGTTIHTYAERLAAGEEVEVPDEYAGHVDAYLAFVEEWQPAELLVERPVFSRKYQYAGTPDLFAVLRDGQTWLLDWKTGGKGVFLDHVLQLAALRYAEFVLDDDGNEVPVPRVDRAGIVWLRADGYDLVPVEAGEEAFFVFRCVKWLADFVTDDRDRWVGDALVAGVNV
jgi:hypothetical protein